jgi:NAD(P)-dependent dehydrogenase (short-subunit alcohol dehydrogenase family)
VRPWSSRPATPTIPRGAPRDLDPDLLAHPPTQGRTGFNAGFRAYSASKLCNLLTARALAASPDTEARQLHVTAYYNPGLIPETALNRDWPAWARVTARIAGRVLRPVARLATTAQAGELLADLTLGRVAGRVYASLVKRRLTWPDPSELAQRDDVMQALWRQSARLVELPPV